MLFRSVLVKHYGYTRIQFSAPIRAAYTGLAEAVGHVPDTIHRCLEGDLKETPVHPLPFSYRQFAVGVGTHWARRTVSDKTWVDIWCETVNAALREGKRIVADDLRFSNEAALVPYMMTVVRLSMMDESPDPTKVEGLLAGYEADWMFTNDETPSHLRLKVHEWAQSPKPPRL